MTSRREHWNKIFDTTDDSQLGWFEQDVSQTIKHIEQIPVEGHLVIFLPGAGTSMLTDKLIARGHTLILNDISDVALSKLKRRVGDSEQLRWLQYDLSVPLPADLPRVDIWIDRAVLHFLTDEADIQTYFDNLRGVVKAEGHVLLAEFSTTGARKCAGLELHRYSVEELNQRMSPDFQLIRQENYTYFNPWGDPRPYIYSLYQKKTL